MISPRLCSLLLFLLVPGAHAGQAAARHDPVAENMVLLQTASGGWSKHFRGQKVDYHLEVSIPARSALADPARVDDATIDNHATTHEIGYLADAWSRTGNPNYLSAAKRGVDYLLAAQYPNGGWPQFYPDTSGYRQHITLNDDAMVRVISLLQGIARGEGALSALRPEFGIRAGQAAERGLACLLALQVQLDGKPTIWAAQYDRMTLAPAKARAYELPSLAVAESVSVVRLLMAQPAPDPAMVAAIESATAWLQAHGLSDLAIERVQAPEEESGHDVRVVSRPGATLWARFYDLEQQRPLFVDRTSTPVTFQTLPNERRVGYAWYGVWPGKLLNEELPRWRHRRGHDRAAN